MNEHFKRIYSKLKNVVKLARVTRSDSDKDLDSVVQVEYMGKTINANVLMPYGISANIPENATLLLLSNNGTSQSAAGIPTFPENRFRKLKKWEVKAGNYKTKCYIYFQDDGTVTVKAGKNGGDIVTENSNGSVKTTLSDNGLDIVAETNITGKTDITGNTSFTGNHTQTGDLTATGVAQHALTAPVVNITGQASVNITSPLAVNVTSAAAVTVSGVGTATVSGGAVVVSGATVDLKGKVSINGVPQ